MKQKSTAVEVVKISYADKGVSYGFRLDNESDILMLYGFCVNITLGLIQNTITLNKTLPNIGEILKNPNPVVVDTLMDLNYDIQDMIDAQEEIDRQIREL